MALSPYTLNFTDDGDKPSFDLDPYELNGPTGSSRSLDIDLFGLGTQVWGERIEENLVRMLENFSCPEDGGSPGNPDPAYPFAPTTPTKGQLWFNSTTLDLKVYDGSGWQSVALGGTSTFNEVNINATPELWDSSYSVLSVGGFGTLATTTSPVDGGINTLSQNYYDSAGDEAGFRIGNDEASKYRQANGQHDFYVAGVGAADSAIVWTTALTINNDGNVGIGTNTPTSTLHIDGVGPAITLGDTAADWGIIGLASSDLFIRNNSLAGNMVIASTNEISLLTDSVPRMTIDNVGVATFSSSVYAGGVVAEGSILAGEGSLLGFVSMNATANNQSQLIFKNDGVARGYTLYDPLTDELRLSMSSSGGSLVIERGGPLRFNGDEVAMLDSPVFTGAPSLPTGAIGVTQAPGDNNTNIATTAYADAAAVAGGTTGSLAGDGYVVLDNGMILQWGTTPSASTGTVSFPIAFPTSVFSVTATVVSSATGSGKVVHIQSIVNASFYRQVRSSTSGSLQAYPVSWIATGF